MRFLQCQVRVSKAVALLIGLLLLLTIIEPASANDNVVLQWNEATLDAIRNTKSAPPIAARALAITHTAIVECRLEKTLGLFPSCRPTAHNFDGRLAA
jgi:hypothetical protein